MEPKQFAENFVALNSKNLPKDTAKLFALKNKLSTVSENVQPLIQSTQLKDPTTVLIISLFFGGFGIDRFYLGQTGLGIAKLLTFGGYGFWAIIDWFLVGKKTREINFDTLMKIN